jgi:hypothetical protein
MTTLPTFHLNGSSPRDLKQEYLKVYRALNEVEKLLRSATCHPRDFYVQDVKGVEGGWENARREREEAFNNLAEVAAYVEEWLLHCSDNCRD